MTDTTRVTCVTTTFAAIDHLLNEMISYVAYFRVAPLYLRVYVDENRHPLRYLCQMHILYLKRPILYSQNDQKDFRNDCGACAALAWQYSACSTIIAELFLIILQSRVMRAFEVIKCDFDTDTSIGVCSRPRRLANKVEPHEVHKRRKSFRSINDR